MSVTINITDPTPDECTALIAYLQAMGGKIPASDDAWDERKLGADEKFVEVADASPSTATHVISGVIPAAELTDVMQERVDALASAGHATMTEVIQSTHFMDAPTSIDAHTAPNFIHPMHGNATASGIPMHDAPQFGSSIDDVPGVETLMTEHSASHFFDAPIPAPAVVDTASIFGGNAAPVPAPTPVPAPVPVAPAAPTDGIERDVHGFPWDARIHAATKAKIADGSWRGRRGVDPALVVQVEAELRAIMGAPAPVPEPARASFTVPPAAAPTPVPVPPITSTPSTVNKFLDFMQFITPHVTEKRITTAQIGSICVALGLPHAGALAKREDLIPAVRERVEAILAGAGAQ